MVVETPDATSIQDLEVADSKIPEIPLMRFLGLDLRRIFQLPFGLRRDRLKFSDDNSPSKLAELKACLARAVTILDIGPTDFDLQQEHKWRDAELVEEIEDPFLNAHSSVLLQRLKTRGTVMKPERYRSQPPLETEAEIAEKLQLLNSLINPIDHIAGIGDPRAVNRNGERFPTMMEIPDYRMTQEDAFLAYGTLAYARRYLSDVIFTIPGRLRQTKSSKDVSDAFERIDALLKTTGLRYPEIQAIAEKANFSHAELKPAMEYVIRQRGLPQGQLYSEDVIHAANVYILKANFYRQEGGEYERVTDLLARAENQTLSEQELLQVRTYINTFLDRLTVGLETAIPAELIEQGLINQEVFGEGDFVSSVAIRQLYEIARKANEDLIERSFSVVGLSAAGNGAQSHEYYSNWGYLTVDTTHPDATAISLQDNFTGTIKRFNGLSQHLRGLFHNPYEKYEIKDGEVSAPGDAAHPSMHSLEGHVHPDYLTQYFCGIASVGDITEAIESLTDTNNTKPPREKKFSITSAADGHLYLSTILITKDGKMQNAPFFVEVDGKIVVPDYDIVDVGTRFWLYGVSEPLQKIIRYRVPIDGYRK